MEFERIAHRGYSAIAPENTLAAFIAAIESGADSIEFDVQLSADGVPVVIHDVTLDKTTRTAGKVTEKTLEQLKLLDAGSWFDVKFSGQQIPSLKEVLDVVKPIQNFIYLDVKPHCEWSDLQIDKFVNTLMSEGWKNRCVVSSFNELFVDRVRSRDREIAIGYLVANGAAYQSQLGKAAADGNAIMISEYRLLLDNPALIQVSQERGVDIVAWTVDSERDFQKLGELGVVRIVTNTLISSTDKK